MVTIRDMVFVKNLEKQVGRSLREDELSGEPFEIKYPDGHYDYTAVPLVPFPSALLPDYALNLTSSHVELEEAGYREVEWNEQGKDLNEIDEDL
jgi:hypothetical protein